MLSEQCWVPEWEDMEVKTAFRTSLSHISALGFESRLCPQFQLPANVHHGKQQMMLKKLSRCNLSERPEWNSGILAYSWAFEE